MKNQKLELTWIGKGNDQKLEPRILIEDPKYSFGSYNSENLLIHGDNLLALKALEQNFSNKIKCIYIDPPYNTGNAFEHYDDGLQHSLWLNLMKPRLEIIKSLLSNDGILFISIDDDEVHYLKILSDEIFGRSNFLGSLIWEKKKKPSFLSNMGSITEYILSYGKNAKYSPPFIYGETTKGKKYPINNAGNGIRILKFSAGSVYFNLKDQIIEACDMSGGNIITRLLDRVEIKAGFNVNAFRLEGEWRYSQSKLDEIMKCKEKILISQIPFRPNHIKEGGEPKKMKNLLSVAHYEMSTYEDATKESELLFGNSEAFDYPKPEKLIYTLINSVTNEGDWVLDSFLGSGTTAAVAHKMNLRWIGIELGAHAISLCVPRLAKVIDGSDQGGISNLLEWKGGGGFKFYTLAPSLIQKDKYGNDIINPTYNANMLAAAMAKQEGFRYDPHESIYWKQGKSSEKDFIFTTTQFITVEMFDRLAEELQPNESLLICCKGFKTECKSRPGNITIKKIPQMLYGRCEFGKDDYSFNIINLPHVEPDNSSTNEDEISIDESTGKKMKSKTNKSVSSANEKKEDESQPSLF
ncbi:MAG: site-specific DNA-methyltransferase [Bacteroidetes bacterium]|nr:site-specific DNA-methyltransferase [Bacteroidota bacterium]